MEWFQGQRWYCYKTYGSMNWKMAISFTIYLKRHFYPNEQSLYKWSKDHRWYTFMPRESLLSYVLLKAAIRIHRPWRGFVVFCFKCNVNIEFRLSFTERNNFQKTCHYINWKSNSGICVSLWFAKYFLFSLMWVITQNRKPDSQLPISGG